MSIDLKKIEELENLAKKCGVTLYYYFNVDSVQHMFLIETDKNGVYSINIEKSVLSDSDLNRLSLMILSFKEGAYFE